jgi:hypothetical protein
VSATGAAELYAWNQDRQEDLDLAQTPDGEAVARDLRRQLDSLLAGQLGSDTTRSRTG